MQKTHQVILAITIGIILSSFPVSLTFAKQPLPVKKHIPIDTVKSDLKRLEIKEKSLGRQVTSLQKNLVLTSRKIQRNELDLKTSSEKLFQLKSDKKGLIQSLSKDKNALSELILALSRLSRTPTETLLFSSNSPLETARADLTLKSVMPKLQSNMQSTSRQISKIEHIEIKIKKQKNTHETQKKSLSKKKGDLSHLLKKRRTLHKKTSRQRQKQADYAKKLAKRAHDLEDLVQKLPTRKATSPKPTTLAKNTPLPVVGNIQTRFGQTDAMGAKTQGISVLTAPTAQVVTPMDGTVRFAGPFQKYKQLLIIEHKQGYHSLIGGMSRIDVDIGTHLITGEPVGIMGNTSVNGQNLYYELRRNGKPINPVSVLMAHNQHKKKG